MLDTGSVHDGDDAEEMAECMSEVLGTWSDGRLVRDDVSGVCAAGRGMCAMVLDVAWSPGLGVIWTLFQLMVLVTDIVVFFCAVLGPPADCSACWDLGCCPFCSGIGSHVRGGGRRGYNMGLWDVWELCWIVGVTGFHARE